MNAIVVLNFNDYLLGAVRDSFRYAAERWGCSLVEVVKPFAPVDHFWHKTYLPFSEHVAPYDRVLVLDGDMLIRSDCPNPFDIVPHDHIGVVSRVQPGSPSHIRRFFAARRHLNARKMGLAPYSREQNHINGGFVLYAPSLNQELWEAWRAAGERCRWRNVAGFREQIALSCLLESMRIPTTWLPWQFNTIHALRRPQAPPGLMATYVYHFTGLHHGQLGSMVSRCRWDIRYTQ